MAKQVVVFGLGHFGASFAREMYALGNDVLGVDTREDLVEDIADSITHAVTGDATDMQVLRSLGITNFDIAVVAIGDNIQSSALIVLQCKELGVPNILAKAQSDLHAKLLSKLGADRIVFPERDLGIRMAHALSMGNVLDFIALSNEHNMVEIGAPKEWVGRSLTDLQVRKLYNINIVVIRRGERILSAPHGEDVIMKEDKLIIVGANRDVQRVVRL